MAAKIRKRDPQGHMDGYSQRRRRYEAVLRPLGLWDAFSRMPRRHQELLWQRKMPDPTVRFDESVPRTAAMRKMRRDVEAGIRKAELEVDGIRMSVRDFMGVVGGCIAVALHTKLEEMPRELAAFLELAAARKAWYEEKNQDAITSLYHAVNAPLIAHSRLDDVLLSARLEGEPNSKGKVAPCTVVRACEPEMRRVAIGKQIRPVYRVARFGAGKVTALSVAAESFRLPGGQRQLPVYVQSHALLQLERRVNLASMTPYLQAWLEDSLENPGRVYRKGRHAFVEYRIAKHRMGYLLVTPVKDVLVVRTFIFLTMEGTPEGRLLQKHLRLGRFDAEWLGLHDLAAFTQTDLRKDPLLRKLLEKCGCGHLLSLDEAEYAPEPRPFAAELRRYLGLAA